MSEIKIIKHDTHLDEICRFASGKVYQSVIMQFCEEHTSAEWRFAFIGREICKQKLNELEKNGFI